MVFIYFFIYFIYLFYFCAKLYIFMVYMPYIHRNQIVYNKLYNIYKYDCSIVEISIFIVARLVDGSF